MIKNYLLLLLCSFILSPVFSQESPSDYSFVVVPERFDFQYEKGQYQLNSLTKFLFEKAGFNPFYDQELPNVSRCDGLWADVVRENGFIWTKAIVVLKDCEGNEVFRSGEGRSKLKEYGKAYSQAIRIAFESIQAMEVQQPDPVVYDEFIKSKTQVVDSTQEDPVNEEKIDTTTVYISDKYELRPSGSSYNLFENGKQIGKLQSTSQSGIFLIRSEILSGIAYKKNQTIVMEIDNGDEAAASIITFQKKSQ